MVNPFLLQILLLKRISHLAEGVGFEPTSPLRDGAFRMRWNKPLSDPSVLLLLILILDYPDFEKKSWNFTTCFLLFDPITWKYFIISSRRLKKRFLVFPVGLKLRLSKMACTELKRG